MFGAFRLQQRRLWKRKKTTWQRRPFREAPAIEMLSHDLRVPCLGFDRIKLCSRKGVVETLIHPQDNVEWGFCIDSSLKGRILVEPFQHRSALNNDFQHLIGCGSKQRKFFAFAMRAMTLLSITLIKYQIIAHTGWRAMLLSCF